MARKLNTMTTLAAFALTASLALAPAADAQARNRQSTVTGANGRTATSQRTVARENGGQTATHDVTRTVDENGNYVKSGTTTGASGDVYNRDVTRDGEGTKTTTVTDPNGETSTRTRWITVEPH